MASKFASHLADANRSRDDPSTLGGKPVTSVGDGTTASVNDRGAIVVAKATKLVQDRETKMEGFYACRVVRITQKRLGSEFSKSRACDLQGHFAIIHLFG
ncbi:MAG: hypothetical protein II767_02950 [Proteobacteria bacterium]|nr:hypothetical protein [Pseudomonadota bacterium]